MVQKVDVKREFEAYIIFSHANFLKYWQTSVKRSRQMQNKGEKLYSKLSFMEVNCQFY